TPRTPFLALVRLTGSELLAELVFCAGHVPVLPRGRPLLRRMAGVDVARLLEPERLRLAIVAGTDRLEEVTHVVAEVETGEDAAHEEAAHALEDRHPARPFPPRPLGELVDLVRRFAAEEVGEIVLVGGD